MKIADLISKLDYHFNDIRGEAVTDPEVIRSLLHTDIKEIYNDSRKVKEGGLFFCIKGEKVDGHTYIPDVLNKGARALVVEQDVDISDCVRGEAPVVIRVHKTRYAMAWISAAWYGNPASRMKIIGITGTKGKTTTTYMVRSILQNAGYKVGLVGTIETLYGDVRIPSPTTTPESMTLQKYFRDMADAGMDAVVMEVSSQALMMHRTEGFIFDYGIFTNLSPDHIGKGEHRDFDHYLSCKSMLFKQCRTGIINGDDPYADRILDGHTCSVETYGLKETNDLYARDLELIRTPGELGIRFRVQGLLDFQA
ncbi:MAG: Mur ligase family protein, partial [bacterium]